MCVHFAKVEEENRDYTDISSICADYYGWRSVVNKELIVTPVSRRHTEQSGNKIATKRVLNVSPIDIIRSEGDVHGPLAQSCVTACNHSTSAPQTLQLVAGGGINKNASSTAWSRPASKHETVAFWFLIHRTPETVNRECTESSKTRPRPRPSQECASSLKFKLPWSAVREARGK